MRPGTRKTTLTPVRSFTILGLCLIAASCGGGGDDPIAPTVGSISITPANPPAIAAGTTLQLTGTVLSTTGQPMSGQTISYSSSAPNIATVSAQGLVTAVGPVGGATITASVGAVTTNVTVTVVAGAAASLTRTSPDPGSVSPGATSGDSVRFVVRDAFGNPRGGETITFTVAAGGGQASPTSAQTDAQGRAATRFTTGTTAGTNTLNATVGGVAPNSFSVTTAASSIAISSVSPSPMTPGATVTIAGSGFNATAGGNAVTINGQAATVTSATATELIVSVPTTLPCTPAHQASVQVTANGASATARQLLRVGALQSLTVGGAIVLSSAADVYCTELSPANAQYAVNVLNASTVPTAVTPFRFAGATSIPAGTTFSPSGFTLRQAARAPDFGRQRGTREMLPGKDPAMHALTLESNRAILGRMKSRFRRTPRKLSMAAPSASLAAVPVVGETRSFRIRQFSTAIGDASTCATYVEITARAVYVGTRGVIYEDAAAPLAGQMDSYFTRIGQEFDASMYQTVNTYFGDPLITDPLTDNDQRLSMVFTPSIPAGVGGFVTGCDFFARNTTDNQSSNFGEYFYATVPTVPGPGFNGNTADRWLRNMRATIIHEVKHIAMFGARLTNPAATSFEQSWLEEGMARVSEEVWARQFIYSGASWKGNMTYATTLSCDVRPTTPECAGAPLVMFDHFATLYDYLDVPGATSVFGRVADGDFVYYAASWSLIRYAADRYAASEVAFLRGITNSTLTGTANLAAQSGADLNQILGMWSLALYLDETVAVAANVDLRFPSWHTRDIFESMNRDFVAQGFFVKPHPLVPNTVPGGDFSIDHGGIHGGSFAPYSLMSATGNTRAVGLSAGASGAPVPPTFRLVVARLQ